MGEPGGGFGFAQATLRHYESYREMMGMPDVVYVQVRLVDGQEYVFRGFSVRHIAESPGSVMVHGTPGESQSAIVVREDHLLAVEFTLRPAQRTQIGFHPNN